MDLEFGLSVSHMAGRIHNFGKARMEYRSLTVPWRSIQSDATECFPHVFIIILLFYIPTFNRCKSDLEIGNCNDTLCHKDINQICIKYNIMFIS